MPESNEAIWRFRSTSMKPADVAREYLREAYDEPRTLADFGGAFDNSGGGLWCFGTQEGHATFALSVDATGLWEVRVS